MSIKRIVFLVSGNGGNLKFIYNSIKLFSYPFEIVAVIADRFCGAYTYAKENNIKTFLVNYSKENDTELQNILQHINCDIVITNIHKILTKNILECTNAKFINLHYSLLPAFTGYIGMKTVDLAKQQNCQFIGATTHIVSEKLDGGKILSQGLFAVDWTCDIGLIYDKVFKLGCYILLNTLLYGDKNIQPINKDNDLIISPKIEFDITQFSNNFWDKII